MSQFTDYAENKIADYFRGQGITLPTNWYAALGSAGTDGSFTELSGTGYARQTVARSLAAWAGTQAPASTVASSGTSHQTSNNAAVSWGTPGAAWGTANCVGLFDASTGGNCWMVATIPSVAITTGSPDPVQVVAGALVFTLGLTGGCSDYLSNKLVDLIWRAQSYTWPAMLYFALYTVAPTNAGGGTEVSGGSYARASLVPSLTSLSGTQAAASTSASSGTGGRISNNAAVTYAAPTADWGTVLAEGIRDASTAGNLLFWGALTAARSVLNGGPAPTHPADSIGLTVA